MKNVRLIRKDENAVSPVIATILMVAITVVLAAVLYVMVSGLLTGPGNAPQLIGVSRDDTGSNYVLRIDTVPAPHSLLTTTFLMRDPDTSAVVNPPGQIALDDLIDAPVGGVQYLPVTSTPRPTSLEVSSVITISKAVFPTAGHSLVIADGTTILYSGTL